MASTPKVQILRSGTSGNRPTGRVVGEPYVNLADMQFGVVNGSNVATDLLGVPIFSTGASYVANNPVNYQGRLYSALVSVSPGVWNPAQWSPLGSGQVYVSDTAPAGASANSLWWDSSSGLLFLNYNDGNSTQWVLAVPLPNVNAVAIEKVQKFTTSGAYTPSPGLIYAIVEIQAPGGGGGAANAANNTSSVTGHNGGGGEYTRTRLTAAQIGASQTVTIGAPGAGSTGAGNNGLAGGNTSFGALCSANGGAGGLYGDNGSTNYGNQTLGGSGGIGDLSIPGQNGMMGLASAATVFTLPSGGGAFLSAGGPITPGAITGAVRAGRAGANYGTGGGGGIVQALVSSTTGGIGGPSIVIVREFCAY
jgi:hypothetical protein